MADSIDYRSKKIVIADLDGTLTESKKDIDPEMASLIIDVLDWKDFAVIGGGRYTQFQKQFVEGLDSSRGRMDRLYLFPTCATAFYRFQGGEWKNVYMEKLSDGEKRRIMDAFKTALDQAQYKKPEKVYGEIIEDRGTQVTFSACGQEAPIELKSAWDPDQKKRFAIKSYLDKLIPEFEVRIGGTTSIDVTKKGIDKAYGIKKISSVLGYSIDEMVFIGDALFEGGNDYPVKQVGVQSIAVSGPVDTKRILRDIIAASR